ncbi:MAG: hypothetical protein R3F11_06470 [Verrucomicrobiales bacterium]
MGHRRRRAREHRIAPGGEEFHYPVLSADEFLGARRAGGNAEDLVARIRRALRRRGAHRDGSSRGTLAFIGGASTFYADQASDRFVAQIDLGSHAEVARWTLPGAGSGCAARSGQWRTATRAASICSAQAAARRNA